jgi:hypothetical protein
MLKKAKISNNLGQYKGLIESIKLANTISTAFDLPRLAPEDLNEATYNIRDRRFNSIYDIVCRQELIKKDLLENKKAFTTLWLNSSEVNSILDFLGNENDKNLAEALANVINSNPYFALATKKQLQELFENCISFRDTEAISNKDVKDFVSKIYEAKKPVKDLVIENLNKKYGVNVQNLKTTPSFNELARIQKNIFESLVKMSPRHSALRTALEDFVSVIGNHAGVDVIDLNEWLVDLFVDADYSDLINETALLNYMNFDKVASDLTKIGQVLKMIQAGMGGEAIPEDGQYEPEGSAEEEMMASMKGENPDMEAEMGEEEEGEEMGDEAPDEAADGDLPPESPEEAAQGAQSDMEAEMGEEGEEEGEGEEGDEEGEEMGEDDFMSYLEDLEGLISSLKSNMGEGGGEDEEGEEGEDEEMPEEEGEEESEEGMEEAPEEEMGDEEEETEEEVPPKKKKPFPPKE